MSKKRFPLDRVDLKKMKTLISKGKMKKHPDLIFDCNRNSEEDYRLAGTGNLYICGEAVECVIHNLPSAISVRISMNRFQGAFQMTLSWNNYQWSGESYLRWSSSRLKTMIFGNMHNDFFPTFQKDLVDWLGDVSFPVKIWVRIDANHLQVL